MPDYRRRPSPNSSTHRTTSLSWSAALLGTGLYLLLSAPSYADFPFTFDAEASYTHDDNVTRAIREVDVLNDSFVAVNVNANYLQWLNANNRLIYRAFVRGEKYNKYEGLSNNSAGGQITYQYRRSGEFTAPVYAAFFRASIAEFESDLRDSNFLTLGASWRRPTTDRITVFAQLAGNVRDSDSTAFDTKEVSLLGSVDYALDDRWTVYFTYNFINGDVVSSINTSAYGALPTINSLVDIADAINNDDAFTDGTWAVYRVKAKTNVAALGTNYRVGEKQSIDLSARYAESNAGGGIKYERWLYSVAYLIRF